MKVRVTDGALQESCQELQSTAEYTKQGEVPMEEMREEVMKNSSKNSSKKKNERSSSSPSSSVSRNKQQSSHPNHPPSLSSSLSSLPVEECQAVDVAVEAEQSDLSQPPTIPSPLSSDVTRRALQARMTTWGTVSDEIRINSSFLMRFSH